MKRQGSTELPRFAVGALAIAGASAANAATVQITFAGSYISTTGGNHLVADFGSDGVGDLFGEGSAGIANLFLKSGYVSVGFAAGSVHGSTALAVVGVGSLSAGEDRTDGVNAFASLRGLAAVSFSDVNIRSGVATNGWLDITAVASAAGEKRVTVNRLIFDDATGGAITGLTVSDAAFTEFGAAAAVPEPSSLGLLALGAGGLLARRRRAMAA